MANSRAIKPPKIFSGTMIQYLQRIRSFWRPCRPRILNQRLVKSNPASIHVRDLTMGNQKMRLVGLWCLIFCVFWVLAGCASAPSTGRPDTQSAEAEEVTVGGEVHIRMQHLEAR
jgi:hypothetical protein